MERGVNRIYGGAMASEMEALEASVTPHPTIVHAAADHRRWALLAEADYFTRTTASARLKHRGFVSMYRRIVAQCAAILTRIVDDFEPRPRPFSPSTHRLRTWTQP